MSDCKIQKCTHTYRLVSVLHKFKKVGEKKMIFATTKERDGTCVRLLMNRRFKNDPSKDEEVGIGEDSYGPYQQFQVMDVNPTKSKTTRAGFMYLRVHTNLSLTKDMYVTIKDILYIQKNGPYTTVACTIMEQSPTEITCEEIEEYEEQGVTLDF